MKAFPEVVLKSNPERQADATEADGTPEEGPSKQKHSCVQRPGAEREHTLVMEAMPPADPSLHQACSVGAVARNLANSFTLIVNG